VILDRERAIRDAVLHAREGDLLLLAGKGHETYEIGKDGRRPFCEEQIVKDAFLLRRNRKKQPDGGATEEDKT
jgi:UDP-N-acetylmuramoyl-L-alanyl-D-glutamate--2,6-diaminopimelate ligase